MSPPQPGRVSPAEADLATWKRVGTSEELAGAGPHAAAVDGVDLVAVRGARGLRVFEGRCPHQGALLGEGEIDDGALVCRNHRWRFSTESGARLGGPQCLRACPTRERDGVIEVDVSSLTAPTDAGTAATARRRKLRDLPGPKPWPLVGSALSLDPLSIHLQLEAWQRTYGDAYTYRFGPRQVAVFANKDDIQAALRDRPEGFRRLGNVEGIFRELGAEGVFSVEGEPWRPLRRLSMEALSQRHLRGLYPALSSVAGRLRDRWNRAAQTGEPLDLADEMKRFTVDVTTRVVFGYDVDTLSKGDDVIQRKLELVFPAMSRRLLSVFPRWRLIRFPADRRVDRAVAELRAWLRGLVADARARIAAGDATGTQPANMLESMLGARDDRGEPFSDDAIIGNAMTMLLGGEDTTAYTLAWAMHHLLDAPGEVVALRGELTRVLGDAPVPADLETAQRLAYAGAIANEAMRLRPVAPLAFLEPLVDTVVGDVELPKGTMTVLVTRPSAISAANFGAPDAFRPARWIDPDATGGAHEPGALFPFGSGPRICPGRSLALLEMKVALATIYQGFDLERVGRADDVREVFSFTMMPTGLQVRLRRRT